MEIFQIKSLLEKVFDETGVEGKSVKDCEQTHGDLFFTTFKGTIAQYCVSGVKELVPLLMVKAESEASKVCGLLTATVDAVARDRTLRKKYTASLYNLVLLVH